MQCSETAFMEIMRCLVSGAVVLFKPLHLNAIFQNQRVTSTNCIYKTASQLYSQ